MLPLGMILTFAGYGVSTWGYILVKGYNITLRQWFSPLHPYTGDLAKAGPVPAGQIFPGSSKGQQQAPQAGAAGPATPSKKSLGSGVPGSLPGAHGGGGAPGP